MSRKPTERRQAFTARSKGVSTLPPSQAMPDAVTGLCGAALTASGSGRPRMLTRCSTGAKSRDETVMAGNIEPGSRSGASRAQIIRREWWRRARISRCRRFCGWRLFDKTKRHNLTAQQAGEFGLRVENVVADKRA